MQKVSNSVSSILEGSSSRSYERSWRVAGSQSR